jgi:hypothetical protein
LTNFLSTRIQKFSNLSIGVFPPLAKISPLLGRKIAQEGTLTSLDVIDPHEYVKIRRVSRAANLKNATIGPFKAL